MPLSFTYLQNNLISGLKATLHSNPFTCRVVFNHFFQLLLFFKFYHLLKIFVSMLFHSAIWSCFVHREKRKYCLCRLFKNNSFFWVFVRELELSLLLEFCEVDCLRRVGRVDIVTLTWIVCNIVDEEKCSELQPKGVKWKILSSVWSVTLLANDGWHPWNDAFVKTNLVFLTTNLLVIFLFNSFNEL